MPRWVWIALGAALVLFLAGGAGWALRDGRARQREQAARDRAFRDSVELAAAAFHQNQLSEATRDSIRRERAALALTIAQAEAASASLAASAAGLLHQAEALHAELGSAVTARDSNRLLMREVGLLLGSNQGLRLALDTTVKANAGLHKQLALDTLDRRNDSTQHAAQLAAAGGTVGQLHQTILSLQDTVRALRGKPYLFGLRFLPKPQVIVGYGLHGEQPRRDCQASGGTDCASRPRWRVAKGFQATIGFHLPL